LNERKKIRSLTTENAQMHARHSLMATTDAEGYPYKR
jgi:hypothetical protein